MTEPRFRILLCESDTGIVLNQAGRRWFEAQPRYEPRFETEAAALALKDDLLTLFPWAEVTLLDGAAPSGVAPRVFHPAKELTLRYRALVERRVRYWKSPLRRLLRREPLDPFNPGSYHPLARAEDET